MSNIKNDNLGFVVKKTIADYVTDEIKTERAERLEQLLEQFDELGVDRFKVKLPNGQTVATLSLTHPKPKMQVNESELMAWLETNGYDDYIETVTIPERTEKKLPVDVLEQIGAIKTDDGEFVTKDGVPVDGAKVVTPQPSAFSVRYEGGNDGREQIIDAWRAGELPDIDAGATLPQIEGAEHE